MSIRARVGRHTQMGGKQCQNWSDDQQAVVDLLNRIAPSNGGTSVASTADRRGDCERCPVQRHCRF